MTHGVVSGLFVKWLSRVAYLRLSDGFSWIHRQSLDGALSTTHNPNLYFQPNPVPNSNPNTIPEI